MCELSAVAGTGLLVAVGPCRAAPAEGADVLIASMAGAGAEARWRRRDVNGFRLFGKPCSRCSGDEARPKSGEESASPQPRASER